MRIAWFSPLPPVQSGVASINAELLPRLQRDFAIDPFDEPRAHDFVWMARRNPYDLVVYQLGNATHHDYMWAYLVRYPGLVVLHDPRLHHARARQLLSARRFDDYRREFWYDHPDARREFVEYAVEGLGGPIYYFWPMVRVVMDTAKLVAVHNPRVAADLAVAHPATPIDTIRLGTASRETTAAMRDAVRKRLQIPVTAIVFAAFGKLTPEKRIGPILRAFARVAQAGPGGIGGIDARLLVAGDATAWSSLDADLAASGVTDRIHVTGYVPDHEVGSYLVAADVCLCLRWPTALETSASWLDCLAARRATIITDLAHLVDIPGSVTLRVDLLDEERSLERAMRVLASDARVRESMAREGYEYWTANHTIDAMAADYGRIIAKAAALPARAAVDLPAHFTRDYTERARAIAEQFGLRLEI